MGWNGSGAFNRNQDFTADRNAGPPDSIVASEKVDDEFNNYKGGLQNCLTRDGQNAPTANISWAGNKITNLGAPTSVSDATNKSYVDAAIDADIAAIGPVIAGFASITPATDDAVLLSDSSDSGNAKKTTVADILALIETRLFKTGMTQIFFGSAAPSGWILWFGTIGNASSGATNRANADTEALYTAIWNTFADAEAPVTGGRGASAAADFAATKAIALPDGRGSVPAILDNLGGTAASRITTAISGLDGTKIGARGGDQRMFKHKHTATAEPHRHRAKSTLVGVTAGGTRVATTSGTYNDDDIIENTTITVTLSDTGEGTSQNVQPTIMMPFIVKL